MDIKESKELLKGLEIIGVSAAKVLANGKIDAGDLSVLVSLLSQSSMLAEAFKGIGNVDDEIKDLSQEELMELVLEMFRIFEKIKMELSK